MTTSTLAERLAAQGSSALPVLEREAGELMTPGVTSIVESAYLPRVFEAFSAHRVHALLVVGERSGHPLGWITARGLLAWIGKDTSLVRARDAITERAVGVGPSASGHEALRLLLGAGVTHVLIRRHPDAVPEGVISELDLVVGAQR